jgi:hypothetical protein
MGKVQKTFRFFRKHVPYTHGFYIEQNTKTINFTVKYAVDRLCGLVARVPGYRSKDPDSIPAATRLSERQWVCYGVHSAS